MQTTAEKYFSEALLRDQPRKKIGLLIKDGSVSTDKLADSAVTMDKLGDDVKDEIHSSTVKVDDEMSATSVNPVQNKVIHNALEEKVDDDDYLTYWNVNKIIFDVFGF